jgi:hypothetical protein
MDGAEDQLSVFDELAAEFEKLQGATEEETDLPGEEELGLEDTVAGDEGEEVVELGDEEPVVEESADKLDEATQLKAVSVDSKDKTKATKSAIPAQKPALDLGKGKAAPVVQKGPTVKGYNAEKNTVPTVTKDTNTVKGQILKAAKVDMKDKAPGAGKSPAMPKN